MEQNKLLDAVHKRLQEQHEMRVKTHDKMILENSPNVVMLEQQAKSEKLPFDLTQIPLSSLQRIGTIFKEGEVKYGKGNWKNGIDNKQFQLERANHALQHLLVYIHDLDNNEYLGIKKQLNEILYDTEDDLAKVAWFCITQMEINRLESIGDE